MYKKEWSTGNMLYNMDEPQRHYTKWKARHKRSHIIWFYLFEISREDKPIEKVE